MALAKGVLSKIHIAKQQLGMDDDIYRALLARVTGVHSSKDLNSVQASRVLSEFERLGWVPKTTHKSKGKPRNFKSPAMPEQITKIEAQLADMGLSWSYADAIAMQMFKVKRMAWLRKPAQLEAIIAALHVEQEKRHLLGCVEALCVSLGVSNPEMLEGLEELPKGRNRQRAILKALVKRLEAAVAAKGNC